MNWLVAVAEFGHEVVAQANLEAMGFKVYFPKYRERKVVRGRHSLVEKFLFGRYFFVYVVDKWRELIGVRGVRELLMDSEQPRYVRDDVVSEIKRREGGDGFIRMLPPGRRTRFRKGQAVRVKQGMLVGFWGIFDREFRGERVRVLFEFMGKRTAVSLRSEELSVT